MLSTRRSLRCPFSICLTAALLIAFGAALSAAADVTPRQVRQALDRGVAALKRQQRQDGRWVERNGQAYEGGLTCLAALALLQAGESPESPALAAALGHIRKQADERTYIVALKIMALAQSDARQNHLQIQAAADWLVDAQLAAGLWTYDQTARPFDHSNTQFALLGLHAAAQAGATVHANVWKKAHAQIVRTQNADGGWAYQQSGNSYGSMTAAGVSDLIILGASTAVPQEHGFRDGAAPNCGKYRGSSALVSGLNWLGRSFRADQNPNCGSGRQWLYYWLYAVERCGILTGQRRFGQHDWYREGADFLVRSQAADGTWGGSVVDTSFAVLFLAKGRKPLLVQKLKWSDNQDWNPDRHDVDNLVSFIGDKLGEPTAWQVVEFDAPLEDWLAAPLLYMQGHTFPRWNMHQREKVRKYIEMGGTLLAEACCGRAAFKEEFEAFVADTFPAIPLHELDPGHPVYGAFYDLKPAGLMGMNIGCRTSVIFSPNDLSCLWEQGDIPGLSERAFKLGTNIAAFAIGRQALRDRLEVVTLPEEATHESGPPAGDALQLAQVVYDGDWQPDPQALVHFAEFLRDELNLSVVTQYKTVRPTNEQLASAPILFMTGHYHFRLSEREAEALAAHLRRGGFLLAEACCGRKEFDEAFREMVKRTFPDQSLKRLPPDHAIFRGQPGFKLDQVGYKPAALAEQPDLSQPELWGLEIDGRLALVYSPYAIGCGLDGHVCYNCRGYVDEDARRLAANIVLYVLTH